MIGNKEGDPMGLTPSGEWLRSDVTLLREGLQGVKGLAQICYEIIDIEKIDEVRGMLGQILEKCDETLWGTGGEGNLSEKYVYGVDSSLEGEDDKFILPKVEDLKVFKKEESEDE